MPSSSMKSRNGEHKCTLGQFDDILPAHPGERWHKTILRKLKLAMVMHGNHKFAVQYFRTKANVRKEQKLHARGRFWFVIHPFSKLHCFVQILFSAVLLERWFSMSDYETYFWINVWEVVREGIWFLLMLSFAFTGYTKPKTQEIIMHPKSTFFHYFCTYFIVDLCFLVELLLHECLPMLLPLLDLSSYLFVCECILLMYIICFIIRLISVFDFMDNFASFTKINDFYLFLFKRILLFICMLHFFAVLFFHIPFTYYYHWCGGDIPETSWIAIRKVNDFNLSGYIESLLIVTSYFLCTNYCDIITEICEQILLIIFSLTGKVYVIVFIAQILVKFIVNKNESTYENLHMQLVNYMESTKVPPKIRKQVLDRFIFTCQKKYFNESELMATVSEQLRMELFIYSGKRLLKKNEFLKKLSAAQKGYLMAQMKSETYSKDEIVAEYGNKHLLYFISSGSISALGENKVLLYKLHDGDEFGQLPTYAPYENEIVEYIVMETSEIFSVNKNVILHLLEEDPHLKKYFQRLVEVRRQLVQDSLKRWTIFGDSLLGNIKKGNILERRLTREIVLE
ncbi:unnamed protein product [Phyllotreta striolata]|uniref:Cyclic nucleotide-binding domain-containing protein n=1 Tax=Phyllotreta striolata TaxID=444603 RepID=A0A9N9TND7_PHYSR|nr:unnamed protein product [Phyllotreta striolata]